MAKFSDRKTIYRIEAWTVTAKPGEALSRKAAS